MSAEERFLLVFCIVFLIVMTVSGCFIYYVDNFGCAP